MGIHTATSRACAVCTHFCLDVSSVHVDLAAGQGMGGALMVHARARMHANAGFCDSAAE